MAKILIISDIENLDLFKYNTEALSDTDFIISCGDLPLDYMSFVSDTLGLPVYYVKGNHFKDRFIKPKNLIYIGGRTVGTSGFVIAGIDGIYPHDARKLERDVNRLLRSDADIDILVTHCPCKGYGDGSGYHEGCPFFTELYTEKHIGHHFYGHNHLNYGGKRILECGKTRLYNAYDHYVVEL